MQCGLEVAAELRDGAWLLVAVSLEMNLSSTRQRINSGQFAAASRLSPAGRGPLDPPTWRFIYLIVVAREQLSGSSRKAVGALFWQHDDLTPSFPCTVHVGTRTRQLENESLPVRFRGKALVCDLWDKDKCFLSARARRHASAGTNYGPVSVSVSVRVCHKRAAAENGV